MIGETFMTSKSSDSQVIPWTSKHTPSEAELQQVMAAEGLRPYQWSNGAHDVYVAHSHPYHKVIYVVSGSITFGLPGEGKSLELRPGDRLELPPGVVHDAVVGSQGVVCLEAHH
jgi:quercetin dioxygenase-like cupin family protein